MKKILFCVHFLLFAALSFGDGGRLSFEENPPADGPTPWIPDQTLYSHSDDRAEVKIEGQREDCFVFEYTIDGEAKKFFITDSKPFRFFYDANQDGECQADELTTAKAYHDPQNSLFTVLFPHVRLPVPLHDEVRIIRVDVRARVEMSRARFEAFRIVNWYEGTLTIGNNRYRSCLIPRSVSHHRDLAPGIVILDTSEDGTFRHFDDLWFCSLGVARVDDKLYNVETVVTDEAANVTLSPYDGPTGSLSIAGTEFHRLYLRTNYTSREIPAEYDLCIPFNEDALYTLPVGTFSVRNAWLKSDGDSELVYELTDDSIRDRKNIAIEQDSLATLNVGGPLRGGIKASVLPILGSVSLDYKFFRNEAGFEYTPVRRNQAGRSGQPPPPRWEVRNAEGRVVKTGKFEYG